MTDEVKLHSQIHSTSEALVIRHEARHSGGEELGPFASNGIAIFGESHQLSEHTSQM